jgi:hypothetical protein
MKDEIIEASLMVALALFIFSLIVWINIYPPMEPVQINCELSEISPDYPPAVKESCRVLRKEKWKPQ